ncbi:MAG TPA: AAA family ATPase [Mycobacteriales bacterium]|nr:AAA family ATPase [Mycobacteriales bacterium]
MASAAATGPLVGRGEELRRLSELIGLADKAANRADRSGGLVLLGGDAGAGKSRLLTELAGAATAAGWRVLTGHCLDFGDGSPPYLPFTEALGRLAADEPELATSLVTASPALARLMPAQRLLGEQRTDQQPADRAAVLDAVLDALQRLAASAPLLLVLEDLHWSDQSTRDLLRFLFTRDIDEPVSILASYRSDDLHRGHPLRAALAEWVRLPAVTRMQLGPLPDGDARQLVSLLSAGAATDVRRILARAEGNPFFIEELVAAAAAGGGALPADLADLLLVRLERLDDAARLTVRAAAVAGRRVSHDLLARGTQLDDVELEVALRAATEANVLVSPDGAGYAFRHALLAEAVYQDLLPGERVRLHAAFAAAIASREVAGSAAELARHARASHDLVTSARASVRAGDEAMSVGGPEEAIRHYELALELCNDADVAAALAADSDGDGPLTRVTLTLRAAAAATAAGHLFRALGLAQEELASLSPTAPVTDRVRLLNSVAMTALVVDTKVDVLAVTTEARRLMADAPPSPLHAETLHLYARANSARARDDEAARSAADALRMARDLGLTARAAEVTILLARLDERAGDSTAAHHSLIAAIAEARAGHEPMAELRGIYNLGGLHFGQGRLTEALDLYQEAAALAATIGRQWAPYGLDATVMSAIVMSIAGDWKGAEALLDVANPPEQAAMMLAALRMEIAAGRGDTEALSLLPSVRTWWERDGLIAITSAAAAIELHGHRGDVEQARAVHDDVVSCVGAMWKGDEFSARIRLAALLLGQLASRAVAGSGSERATLLPLGETLATSAEQVAEHSRHLGPEGEAWRVRAAAEVARLRWLSGEADVDELVAAWRDAVAGFERFGHVYETARSRTRLGAILLAGGQPDAAAEQLELASTTARALGARPLLDELTRLRATRPPAAAEHPTALTAREREVLDLVATGRSNRDIAQQLFISAKTVSVHVSNVLAKLDAASRTEAVAIARARGLLD